MVVAVAVDRLAGWRTRRRSELGSRLKWLQRSRKGHLAFEQELHWRLPPRRLGLDLEPEARRMWSGEGLGLVVALQYSMMSSCTRRSMESSKEEER